MTACWHTMRVMGAHEIVRRRVARGWPDDPCPVRRGWHVVCTACLEVEPFR